MSVCRIAFWMLALVLSSTVCSAADQTVDASNFAFTPATVTINAGESVTFRNPQAGFHNVVADDGSFACATSCSGAGGNPSASNWTVTRTFPQAGTFKYYCSEHGAPGGFGMAGVVIVNAVAAPAPTITTFTASGASGDTVTIVGTNFSATAAQDTVKFNGTTATVTAASTTSLDVTVPDNATSGTISVTVGAQTVTSTSNFTVLTPPPPAPPISGATSGAWYNPQQSGHGFIIQIYDTNNTFLAVWFVYTPDGAQQAWIWAQGTYNPNSNSITIADAFYTKGGRFPPNFVPGSATHIPWGTITFSFDSCNSGTATWSSSIPEFGSGTMPLTRLAGIKGLTCP